MMGGFSVLHALFQRAGKNAATNFGKFIALLICVPCFQASHFFFKIAYLLNQRKLRRLCREDFLLKIYNRPIPSGRFVDTLHGLRHIKGGLDCAQAAYRFSNNHGNTPSR